MGENGETKMKILDEWCNSELKKRETRKLDDKKEN